MAFARQAGPAHKEVSVCAFYGMEQDRDDRIEHHLALSGLRLYGLSLDSIAGRGEAGRISDRFPRVVA